MQRAPQLLARALLHAQQLNWPAALQQQARACATAAAVTAAPEPQWQQAAAAASSPPPGQQLQQRYRQLLDGGVLKPDARQAALVGELAGLLTALDAYSRLVADYRLQRREYEARAERRLAELQQQDDARQRQEQEQQQQQVQQQQQQVGWLSSLLTKAGLAAPAGPAPAQSPAQRARAAAAARRARVAAELGQRPAPPAAPQGLYVHGSVGSGKSLLMDLFYDVARSTLPLDHTRRIHFNAAMLELNSRLHVLDTARQARQAQRRQAAEEEAAAAAAAADVEDTDVEAAGADGDSAHGGAAAAQAGGGDEGCCDDAASDAQVSAWFDEGVLRQKEAKAAVLAIRRHLRESRAGRVPASRLASANAAVMSAAARSLIRAGGSDPHAGWDSSSSSSSSSGSISSGPSRKRGERLAALLCFDEMQIADVFAAAALKALLEALTAEGVVVVATSNRHPADLPRHGLHEAMFGNLLHTLFTSCRLFELSAADDYRKAALAGPATALLQQPLLGDGGSSDGGATYAPALVTEAGQQQQQRLYFWPLSPAADAALNSRWAAHASASGSGAAAAAAVLPARSHPQQQLQVQSQQPAAVLPVMFGRRLAVPRAAGGAAWFGFSELCGQPLGAADYLAVAQAYHTIFISGIPALSEGQRDQARRFITLLDELYNARCLLVCSAAAPPDQLFAGAEGGEAILDLEGLQFEGAVEGSRLRRDLTADGGVAPLVSSTAAAAEAAALLGGAEERFAFSRAVSRLYEMQSPLYAAARARH